MPNRSSSECGIDRLSLPRDPAAAAAYLVGRYFDAKNENRYTGYDSYLAECPDGVDATELEADFAFVDYLVELRDAWSVGPCKAGSED